MTFIKDVESLPVTLVHHTGSMIRLVPSQLVHLPSTDVDLVVELPDGSSVKSRFRCHPANPYLAGRDVVGWIKSWLPYGATWPAQLQQVGASSRVRLVVSNGVGAHVPPPLIRRARDVARALSSASARRRRTVLEQWERDPSLREFVLARWGTVCQVQGCAVQTGVPSHLASKIVDVHHLTHVSAGGNDSPLNLCVLCTAHHALVHRAASKVLSSDNLSAQIQINGIVLELKRDVSALMVL